MKTDEVVAKLTELLGFEPTRKGQTFRFEKNGVFLAAAVPWASDEQGRCSIQFHDGTAPNPETLSWELVANGFMKRLRHADKLAAKGEVTAAKLKSYEYDSGDKRSCGSLTVVAETNLGELTFTQVFGTSGSSESDDSTATLGGKTFELEEWPDFAAPHYYSGKAVERFKENAEQWLQESLDEWLQSQKD